MKTVQILLSTYNGEKYLRELLDSIISQIEVNVKIMARDDGSNDSTVDILEEYRKNGKLQYFAEKNVGYAESFMRLADYCKNESEYYAFCDQDDFWEPNKIIVAVKKLEGYSKKSPKMYYSNLKIADEKLNVISSKKYDFKKRTLGEAMVRNGIAGCVMVFNNELLKLALRNRPSEIISKIGHDAWLYRVCLSVGGELVFDSNSYIKYRQHGSNVTGIQQGIKKRFLKEIRAFRVDKNINSHCAEALLNNYSQLIPQNNLVLLRKISTYRSSFIKTVGLLFCNDLKFGEKIIDVLNRIKIIFRCY